MPIVDPKYLKFLQNIFKRNTDNDDHEAVITSMEHALEIVEEDSDLVKKELMLETADDDWLEDWGAWFGLSRLVGETDDHFRYRILTCMDDKVSIPAIKNGIKKIMGEDTQVSVYEPFEEVRMFNMSTFSGKGRYEDKYYYRVGVIDISINKEVTSDLERYVKLLASAGIRVYIHTV